jgi:ribosomal protein S18
MGLFRQRGGRVTCCGSCDRHIVDEHGEIRCSQDLNPYVQVERVNRPEASTQFLARPSARDVLQKADFKNVGYLNSFLSEVGNMMPRRRTRLQQKVHRYLHRQVSLMQWLCLLVCG